MTPSETLRRYRSLESYVDWTKADAEFVRLAWDCVAPRVESIVDDFYQEIERHMETARVITGGPHQIARLKQSLTDWLQRMFLGPHDDAYMLAHNAIGQRHVAIGLRQAFVSVAMARLRNRILQYLWEHWGGSDDALPIVQAVSKRLDLDLAVIGDAYQSEYLTRQQPIHESRLRQQRAIVDLGQRALAAANLSSLFEFAAALAADVLSVDRILILEAAPAQSSWTLRAAFGLPLPEGPARVYPLDPMDLAGRSFLNASLLVVDDVREGGRGATTARSLNGDVISAGCAPIFGEEHTWGVLLIQTFRLRPFVPSDQDCLHAMANVLSAAIQRSQAESRMRQAERLAGIGQMVTGLAHESRNALQRIQACTEMLQLELAPDTPSQQWVARIGRALDDLNHLFEEVRNYAAPVVLERTVTNLIGLWEQAWTDVRHVHPGRRLELRTDVSSDAIMILADSYRLGQVFRNLFENALAACEDPVQITISAQECADGSRKYVRVRVSDNGPGIDERHFSRIFDPFFTTKTKGTGLGLSICRRILEAHGGTISIETCSGPGAHFTLRLPKG